jgi:hypothetical protein
MQLRGVFLARIGAVKKLSVLIDGTDVACLVPKPFSTSLGDQSSLSSKSGPENDMNCLTSLLTLGKLHSYIDLPETPRMSCILNGKKCAAWNMKQLTFW